MEEDLMKRIIKIYKDKKINPEDLVLLTTRLMLMVEKLKMTGPEKKEAVLKTICLIIENSGLISEENAETASMVVKLVLPNLIDSIIDTANGGIKFKGKTCCY